MKVLGIVCSPRKGGNTEILVKEALTRAKDCGAETELLTVWDKEIKPCDGCAFCADTGKCHIEDDMQEIYLKFLDTDGIIWGTPVYFSDVTAQAKIIIDRLYALYKIGRLANKVAGVISVAGGVGHASVWNLFTAFFAENHMFSVDLVYGFASKKGDILKDKHAMKSAWELGRQVVLTVERQFRFPEEYDIPMYRYVEREYGISSSPTKGRFNE
ncbi:flavodoxin family protein [Chloroflexota bacterium]